MKSIVQIFIVAILQKLPICCMGINYTFKLKSVLYYTQQLQKSCVIQSTIFIIEYINYHYKSMDASP